MLRDDVTPLKGICFHQTTAKDARLAVANMLWAKSISASSRRFLNGGQCRLLCLHDFQLLRQEQDEALTKRLRLVSEGLVVLPWTRSYVVLNALSLRELEQQLGGGFRVVRVNRVYIPLLWTDE